MDKKCGIETPSSIYLMHKYWGKKPSLELKNIILKYSKENDLILDPFSGYGGIGIEGILLNRNVLLNDLNPISNFISDVVLNVDIDLKIAKEYFEIIKEKYKCFADKWYTYNNEEIIAILRDNYDNPIKLKLYNYETKKVGCIH